jgi:peptidyl-prolyl cis-trans isomerase SurA
MRVFCKIFIAVVLFTSTLLSGVVSYAQTEHREGIVATVNDEAITASDLNDRLHLVMASSGMPDTAELKAKFAPQILSVLVEERVKIQEASKDGITVTDADIDRGFATVAAQNNISAEQFADMLKKQGLNPGTLRDQIRAQIAWGGVIQKKLRPQVDVTDTEIDAELARLNSNIGKNEYLVSEIFLPVDQAKDEPAVKQVADRITHLLTDEHAPFPRVASQFSQSASAARGGDLGWIEQGQLPKQVDALLATMKPGDLSQPIRTLSGYSIVVLRQSRTIAKENMPSADDVRQQIGLARLDRLQRRFLLDLKSAAFIDLRS